MNIVDILYNKIYCRINKWSTIYSHKCFYSDLVNLWW